MLTEDKKITQLRKKLCGDCKCKRCEKIKIKIDEIKIDAGIYDTNTTITTSSLSNRLIKRIYKQEIGGEFANHKVKNKKGVVKKYWDKIWNKK